MNFSEIIKVFDGGKGSGHFEHVGIPRHKGGSARSGKYFRSRNRRFSNGHVEYGSGSTLEKLKRKYPEFGPIKTRNYAAALDAYTNGDYNDIKDSYRYRYKVGVKSGYSFYEFDRQKFDNYSHDLDDFIYQAPKYKGEIYRGLNLSEEQAKDIIKNLKEGRTADMQGVSSWSSSKEVALKFGKIQDKEKKNIVMLFTLPENKSGTSVKYLSLFSSAENEVLHPTTARYKLDGDIEIGKPDERGFITINVKVREV